jgi:FAR-17a/AIG1-like protein
MVAIGCQLLIHLRLGLDAVNFFSYFTNLANLLAAATLLIGARMSLRAIEPMGFDVLRAMATVSMVVVGIVFSVLLRNADLGSLQPWVNAVVHYVMPCVIVADWILWPPKYPLRFRELLLCQIAPAAYLTYVLIRGAWIGWYPYPFFNPAVVGGYGNVAIYAVGIAGVFLLAGLLLFWVAKRLKA